MPAITDTSDETIDEQASDICGRCGKEYDEKYVLDYDGGCEMDSVGDYVKMCTSVERGALYGYFHEDT